MLLLFAATAPPAYVAPVATPTPHPTLTPSPTPRPTQFAQQTPSPQPTLPPGSPRQFGPPDVRPKSPHSVAVYIEGPPIDPTPIPQAFPSPSVWTIGLPNLRESDGSSVLELTVTDRTGAIVARGVANDVPRGGSNFEAESFELDRQLAASEDVYTVTARSRDDASYVGSSDYFNPHVPENAGTHIGDRYVLTSPSGAPTSTILYLTAIERDRDEKLLTVETRGRHHLRMTVKASDIGWTMGAMVVSPDIVDLRKSYLGSSVTTNDFDFVCYNDRQEAARVALLPGKHLHIDLVARAAHALTWLPNDPRVAVYSIPCNGRCADKTGAFVESPLVVGFTLDPNDVRVIPPMVMTHIYAFHGNCIRGYAVLRDAQQVRDVFSLGGVAR